MVKNRDSYYFSFSSLFNNKNIYIYIESTQYTTLLNLTTREGWRKLKISRSKIKDNEDNLNAT